jgi:molybdate transport system ATP-binding protein
VSGPHTLAGEFDGKIGNLRLDCAFEVPARGVTALYGPSGAGKTSLIRCLAGLERVAGRLTVKGQVWQDGHRFLPPWKRRVGLVFQDQALFAHLSVRGNLLYGSKRGGQGRVGFDETVALMGLAPLLDRSIARLSGGEGRRVAIGRALLSQPELLLLDEPLAGLDLDAKAEALAYLQRLQAELAVPMIFVSHDPAEIARLADRVLVMESGRIVRASDAVSGPAAAIGAEAARDLLAGETPDRLAQLALAALLAGLAPAKVGHPDA